mmetsp:Transcript_40210/g.85611  ORF Transcript_40210/g.85611 Transcript_40210/m.85611 type:complete len:217 (-) Transcript_40210:56-706(-)
MLSSESCPLSVEVLIGTPITGRGVMAATMPGRWAAPPAPAITACRPRPAAEREYVMSFSGVRCALTMSTSWGIPNSFRILTASFIVGRSDWEPMMTPTSGHAPIHPSAGRTSSLMPSASSSCARGPSSSAWESAVMLMCPIFRPGRYPFPYQWTLARGMDIARLTPFIVCSIPPDGAPRTLTIAAAPTTSSVSPSGSPHTALRWFSNWLAAHASCV